MPTVSSRQFSSSVVRVFVLLLARQLFQLIQHFIGLIEFLKQTNIIPKIIIEIFVYQYTYSYISIMIITFKSYNNGRILPNDL